MFTTAIIRRFASDILEVPRGTLPGDRFVVFIQNHDQVANTSQGARLSHLDARWSRYRIAVALLLCSPCLPLLFMGEEFAETNPFLYFTSHGDPGVSRSGKRRTFEGIRRVHCGRRLRGSSSRRKLSSDQKLLGTSRRNAGHRAVLKMYCELIRLRKHWPCLRNGRKDLTHVEFDEDERWLRMERRDPSGCRAVLICNFSDSELTPDWTRGIGNSHYPPPPAREPRGWFPGAVLRSTYRVLRLWTRSSCFAADRWWRNQPSLL